MPKNELSKARVLEVRAGYRLVDRTDTDPNDHAFCVENDTGEGWALVQSHPDESTARAQFNNCTAAAP